MGLGETICNNLGYFKPVAIPPQGDACLEWKKKVTELANQKAELEKQKAEILTHVAELDAIIKEAQNKEFPHPKETYWNNKYPKDDTVRYTCRYIHLKDGTLEACQVDPRIFFQPIAGDLKGIALALTTSLTTKLKKEPTNDDLALACLQYVMKNIKYTSDEKVQGIPEYWQEWYETIELKTGDCEDGSILLANLMTAVGIPYWRIRLNAGDVKGGGHAYVTYCRETDDEFVVLDWCYWPKDIPIKDRKLHHDEMDYYGIWWSWNIKYIFKKVKF